MRRRTRSFRVRAGALLATVCALAVAQLRAGTFTWDGGAADGNWGTGVNWIGDLAPASGTGADLHFAGSVQLGAVNNFAAGVFHSLIFDASAGSFNLTGNGLTLQYSSFTGPQLENLSTATQTFNLSGALQFENTNQSFPNDALVAATGGSIVFNNAIDLAGPIDLHSVANAGKAVTFNGAITSSGNAGNNGFVVGLTGSSPYSGTTIVTGIASTFGGGTTVYSGTLQLGSTGASAVNGSLPGAINLGQHDIAGNMTPAARVVLAGSGGQTFSNAIDVPFYNTSNGGERAIVGQFSGTNTVAGTVTLSSPLTVATAAGSTLQFDSIVGVGISKNVLIGSDPKAYNPGTLTNAGTITFGGSTDNSYVSAIVSSGTLVLAKSSSAGVHAINSDLGIGSGGTVLLGGSGANQIADTAGVVLAGGRLNTAGLSETVGVLTLHDNSIIDLGNGASILAFAKSSNVPWDAGTSLSIYNWSGDKAGGGADQVLFGGNAMGLSSAQLNQIMFYSDGGVTPLGTAVFAPMADGEIVPAPEPATWVPAAFALGALLSTQLRRRRTRSRGRS
jgi:autotransporter-associated beta strand protein